MAAKPSNLTELNRVFEEAKETGSNHIGMSFGMGDGYLLSEVITFDCEDFDSKQKYYNLTYDNFLEHKHADNIKITGFAHGDSLRSIEGRLVAQMVTSVFEQTKQTTIGGI